MQTGETRPYDQLSDEEKTRHNQGAPINENHDQYEQNIDVAHEMANAETPDRDIINRAKKEGLGPEFIEHREAAAKSAANIAGEKERERIKSEEGLINQAIDLLKEDAEGDNKARLILYVFDKDGAHEAAYREYVSKQLSEEDNSGLSYNYKIIDMSLERRQQLARLLGVEQLSPVGVKEQNEGEKRYSARSAEGYLREVAVDLNVEDNPNNPEAIIFDRYRAE